MDPNGYYGLPDVVIDVASLRISSPGAYVDCEQPQDLGISIANIGNVDVQNFKLFCQLFEGLDTVRIDTLPISYLMAGETLNVPFGPYDLPDCHVDYIVRGITRVQGDRSTHNDTTASIFHAVYSHDLACCPILSPLPDSIQVPIIPQVMIENVGLYAESHFGVGCEISLNDSIVYSQVIEFQDDLPARSQATVSLPEFQPPFDGRYHFHFYHSLTTDRYIANDFASIDVELQTTSISSNEKLPLTYQLYQNYPNPFNPITSIVFDLPKPCDVRLNVYSLGGQKAISILDKPMPAGHHTIEVNLSGLSSGIYFYRLEAGEREFLRRMVLLK
jgi:hypothetical protein